MPLKLAAINQKRSGQQ